MVSRTLRAAILSGVLVAGCSGLSPTQVGQMAGTIAGVAIIPGIGAPLGTLVGTLAGLVVEGQMEKAREKQERVDLSKQLSTPADWRGAQAAQLPMGEPARVWVDERLENGRLINGHFEFRPIP